MSNGYLGHKVHVYLEYNSVCHLVRFGTPTPLSYKRVCSPQNQKGGHSLLRMRGSQFGRLGKKPSTLSPLCAWDTGSWMWNT